MTESLLHRHRPAEEGASAVAASSAPPPDRAGGKKLINDPRNVVDDALAGLAEAHRDLVRIDRERRVVVRRDAPVTGRVAVLSGGGSGHDPLHAGYVGHGMLDAACAGNIFTSPGPDSIVAATHAVDGGEGVVYVVKNYTGDVMNFGLAAAAGERQGIPVERVIVADDVATAATDGAGRRGTGATVLVEKIAGAAAQRGLALVDVAAVARRAVDVSRTYGVALTPCTNPEYGAPTFTLPPDEIEFGVGIHGERGRRRAALTSAASIVDEMVEALVADLSPSPGSELLAFVNGFGGTPLMELYIAYAELQDGLGRRGFRVARRLVGNYLTTLDMAGLSITLLVLDGQLRELWDDPVHTAALRWGM